VAAANAPDRYTGYTPTRPRRHSGSERFSPVNTIDPPPERQPANPAALPVAAPPANPDDQRRLTIMRAVGDQSGKSQLCT